jgi:hypothetical protein
VYWGNGCQIIPPHDAGIAAAIEAYQELWQLPDELPQQLVYDPGEAISSSYYAKLQQHLRFCSEAENGAAAAAVYTPLHGVGGKFVLRAFQVRSGFVVDRFETRVMPLAHEQRHQNCLPLMLARIWQMPPVAVETQLLLGPTLSFFCFFVTWGSGILLHFPVHYVGILPCATWNQC